MTEVRRVEITEPGGVKHKRTLHEGPRPDPENPDGPPIPGDIATLPEPFASEVIARGWGKDAATGETGERVEGAVKIEVHDSEGGSVSVNQ